MKSRTVRGIDPVLEKQIKLVAKKGGKSIDQVIIDSLPTSIPTHSNGLPKS